MINHVMVRIAIATKKEAFQLELNKLYGQMSRSAIVVHYWTNYREDIFEIIQFIFLFLSYLDY